MTTLVVEKSATRSRATSMIQGGTYVRCPSLMTTLDSIVEYLLQEPVDVVLYLWIESSYPPHY